MMHHTERTSEGDPEELRAQDRFLAPSRTDDLFRTMDPAQQAGFLAAKLADLDHNERRAVYAQAEQIAESFYE